MTDAKDGAAPPKKRSFFKRAAWQDAPKKEETDMFSHANEFKDIVADQQRREEEQRMKAEARRQKKQGTQRGQKRCKVSLEHESSIDLPNGSGSPEVKLRTSQSIGHSPPRPGSLMDRYESLAKATSPKQPSRTSPVVINIPDSDEEDTNYINHTSTLDDKAGLAGYGHDVTYRQSKPTEVPADDDLEEVMDPKLAALRERARERAKKAESPVAQPAEESKKGPLAKLLIDPQIPNTNPLIVRIRVDSTIEETKIAWCDKQGFSDAMKQSIIFTWKGNPIYDSTTIKRLGINVDEHGFISVDGDSTIYDDTNLPKVHIEAWTEELFKQRKKEEAGEAAARKKATEHSPEIEERAPTPEAQSQATKIRLILKAKGKDDFKLSVNPDTTFGQISFAYKGKRGIEESQPITLMFDGERLSPLDSLANSEVEDMDSLEVLFK